LDPTTGNCYLALNVTTNFWNASTSLCKDNVASLLEFDDDKDIQGLIGLISKGI